MRTLATAIACTIGATLMIGITIALGGASVLAAIADVIR